MQPKIYPATDHDIDPLMLDPDALYVLNKLKEAGFIAYLVGGGVRDLLSKKEPKDFDISTSALPEQVKEIFRRKCILIGKRFRLAHVRFGKKIIEVATFRSGDVSDEGLITRDNEWGTPEQDVLRRDFTINGLFYDPHQHHVIDYVGGWEDIHRHTLRVIGNPQTRFKQDPVRMLRLLKFRARFGFHVDVAAEEALQECKEEIMKSSPARILEEMLRMMESGCMVPFFQLMKEYHFLDLLYPGIVEILGGKTGEKVERYLSIVDQVHQKSGAAVLERPIILSALLFPVFEQELDRKFFSQGKTPNLGEIALLAGSLTKELVANSFSSFPRRLSCLVSYVLATQYRLTPLSQKRINRQRTMQNRDFFLALRFLQLRALYDSSLVEDYTSWKKAYRQQPHQGDHKPRPRAPRRRKRHVS